MRSRLLIFLVLALSALSAANAAPFQNGSFETGASPGAFNPISSGDTTIASWTVTGGGIDYIGTYWTAAEGSRSVDLNGLISPGSISQVFDTVAGHAYEIKFSMSGNLSCGPAIKTVTVQASGGTPANYNFDTTSISFAAMGWIVQTYNFTATAAQSTLTFTGQNPSACGTALDNVVLRDTTSVAGTVIPVPTSSIWSLAVLVVVLGVVAGLKRRRYQG